MGIVVSNNDKGNKLHDSTTGEFIGKNSSLNLDASSIQKFLEKKKQEQQLSGFVPEIYNIKNLNDAQNIGDKIFGRNGVVLFSKDTDLEIAKNCLQGLYDIQKDFSNATKGIVQFGTGYNKSHFDLNKSDFLYYFFNSENKPLFNELINKGKSNEEINFIKMKLLSINDAIQKAKLPENIAGYSQYQQNKAVSQTTNEVMKCISCVMINKKQAQSINGFEMGNFEKSGIDFVDEGRTNFHLKNARHGSYETTVHELGHAVSYVIDNFMTLSEKQQFNSMLSTIYPVKMEKYNSIPDKFGYYTQYRYFPINKNDASDIVKAFNNGEVSRYALTSKEEAIAEAFADYYGNREKCSNYNKKIVDFMKKIYDNKMKA